MFTDRIATFQCTNMAICNEAKKSKTHQNKPYSAVLPHATPPKKKMEKANNKIVLLTNSPKAEVIDFCIRFRPIYMRMQKKKNLWYTPDMRVAFVQDPPFLLLSSKIKKGPFINAKLNMSISCRKSLDILGTHIGIL